MKIFLVGYMGSGKSTIGKKVSEFNGMNFIDFDDYISEKESMSIKEIFSNKGEIYFRKIEKKYLLELLDLNGNFLIALGGGTPCYGDNMDLINQSEDSKSIYLNLSVSNLTERLFNEKDSRPLILHLQSKEELQEYIGKHLFERHNYYSKSDIIINANNQTIDALVNNVLELNLE